MPSATEGGAGRATKNLEEFSAVSNWSAQENPERELTDAAAQDLGRVLRAAPLPYSTPESVQRLGSTSAGNPDRHGLLADHSIEVR